MKSELFKIPKMKLNTSEKWGYNIIGYEDSIELEYFEQDEIKDIFRVHPIDALVLFEEALKITKQVIADSEELQD